MSRDLAAHVLDVLAKSGVKTLCVCPGARNAEWVKLAATGGFEVFWFFEERSAGFFALGRIRSAGNPVAVVTTSGTAAGELLPPTMEAFYSGLPVYLLTADRPRRFRGTGAPQSAEQAGIFGVYTPLAFDLEGEDRLPQGPLPLDAPVHINACFEDPKGAGDLPEIESGATLIDQGELEQFIENAMRPLVIVGELHPKDRSTVAEFLAKWGAPSYLESTSGLRGLPMLGDMELRVAERLLSRAAHAGFYPDCVLRIGGVPTHRFWRDLEDRASAIPVVSVSLMPLSGLARSSRICVGRPAELLGAVSSVRPVGDVCSRLHEEDRVVSQRLEQLLRKEPTSEAGAVYALSKHIPSDASMFLGNSLPIRDWDLAADRQNFRVQVTASRGLNGIDGQVSTFLGLAATGRANWALLGDLTTLYDLSGPWIAHQLPSGIELNLVVLNNGGGKIFDRMFTTKEFQNAHSLTFKNWAEMWGAEYESIESVSQLGPAGPGFRVIELRPDPEATAVFWASLEEVLA